MLRSIAARLTLGFLVTLVALLVITLLGARSFTRLFASASMIQSHHLRESSLFEDIRVVLTDAVHQDWTYILTSADAYDEAFEADMDEIARLVEEHASLHTVVSVTPPEVESMKRLRTAVERLASVHDQVQELVVEGQLPAARRLSASNGRAAAQAALTEIRRLVQDERREADELLAEARASARRTNQLTVVLGTLATLASGAAALSLIRSVTVPVHRLVDVTRRVDRGNLSLRSGLRGRDEIGELAQSFDRMIERLEVAFAQQERFLADVSHELRTPITIVRGNLEALQRSPQTSDRVERAVATGLDELDRMGRLVNDLLLLTRATRMDFLRPEPLALAEFLPDVLAKAEGMASRRWRLGPVPATTLVADRDRLTQALLNLLRNAVDHTAAQGTIVLSAATAEGTVHITVRDDGTGIPADLQPQIFERFRRGAEARPGGWGLGLSIVQAIARAHGGEVVVESRPGQGSTFTLSLPARSSAPV